MPCFPLRSRIHEQTPPQLISYQEMKCLALIFLNIILILLQTQLEDCPSKLFTACWGLGLLANPPVQQNTGLPGSSNDHNGATCHSGCRDGQLLLPHAAATPNSPTSIPLTAQPACNRSTALELPFRVLLRGLPRGAAPSLRSGAATSSGEPPGARRGPHGSLTAPAAGREPRRGRNPHGRAPGEPPRLSSHSAARPGRPQPLSPSAAPQQRRGPASQPRALLGALRWIPEPPPQPPGPHLGPACGRSGARGRGLCALGSAAPRQNGGRGRALTSRPFPSPVPSRHASGRGGWG